MLGSVGIALGMRWAASETVYVRMSRVALRMAVMLVAVDAACSLRATGLGLSRSGFGVMSAEC